MKKVSPFLVLSAGILWGMIGIFVRRLNTMGFASMDIVAIRAATTVLLLFLFLFFYDKKMLKIRLKDIWCFLGTGILSIVFFNYCYFKAITMTSLSVAAILLYTAPAIVMILSAIIFHEKITMVKLVSLVATFLGCVLVTGLVGTESGLSAGGILVGLGAGLGYALYSIFSRFAIKKGYHSLTISFYTFFFAVIGTIPLCDRSAILDGCFKDIDTVGFCMLFGLVSTVIPYIVYTLGLKDMDNSQAAIIASVEPMTATLLGVLVYHEELLLQHVIGVLLVLGAIILCNVKIPKK
ncbi:MAG: DMT family transporter [Wujia sp.]